jgi:hypothetical protein
MVNKELSWSIRSFGEEQSRLQRERCCAAWVSAKPYGSVRLILSWRGAELAS